MTFNSPCREAPETSNSCEWPDSTAHKLIICLCRKSKYSTHMKFPQIRLDYYFRNANLYQKEGGKKENDTHSLRKGFEPWHNDLLLVW